MSVGSGGGTLDPGGQGGSGLGSLSKSTLSF